MGFKKANIKYILIFFIVSSLGFFQWKKRNNDHVILAHKLIHSFEKKARKEFDLYSIGSGGSMINNIGEIDIMFVALRRSSLTEARELQVKCTQKFAEIINSNKKIRPFLREYPFNAERIEISISFKARDTEYFEDGSIAFVSQTGGDIFYRIFDVCTGKLTLIKKEPYEEALRIVTENAKADPDGIREVIDRLEKKYGFQKING